MEISSGREVSKPNFLKESMVLEWNFQRGWGVQAKNLEWEGYGYFLYQYNPILHCEVNPRGFIRAWVVEDAVLLVCPFRGNLLSYKEIQFKKSVAFLLNHKLQTCIFNIVF